VGINTYPVAASGTTLTTAKKFSGKITKPTTDPFLGNYSYGAGTRIASEFGNSTWVTIAGAGRIATSTDGTTWNYIKNNLLVAALTNTGDGNGSTAATQAVTVGYRSTIGAISLKFGGGIWAVYMSNGTLLTSTDLITWTLRMTATQTGGDSRGYVAYGNSNWALATRTPKVFSSTDNWVTYTDRTTAWTTGNGAANAINRIIYANSLWITIDSGGLIATSSDFATWTARTTPFGGTACNDIATNSATAGATTVIVGATGKWAYSTNGTTWTINTANGTESHVNIVWDGSRFCIFSTSTTGNWYSTNGQGGMTTGATRATVGTPATTGQTAAANTSGLVLFNPTGTFQTTANITTTWGAASAITLNGAINQLNVVVSSYNPTYHSAVDGAGKIWRVGTIGKVWVSSDGGTTWTFANVAGLTQFTASTTAAENTIGGFAYVNGVLFAFTGSGTAGLGLKYSTDNGATWANASTVAGSVSGIAYGNGVYVVTGSGVIGASGATAWYATTPGGTWTVINSGSTGGATSGLFYHATGTTYDAQTLFDVSFDTVNGFFQIWSGATGTTFGYCRSIDGITWIAQGVSAKTTAGTPTGITITGATTANVVNHAAINTGSAVNGVSTNSYFLAKMNKSGKEVILVRNSTGTVNQMNCLLASRTNATHLMGNMEFDLSFDGKVLAPYLNIISVAAANSTQVEPVYLNYNDNYGWIAIYFWTTGGTAYNYEVLTSADGEYWDKTAGITVSPGAQPLMIVSGNDNDKLFLSIYSDNSGGSSVNTTVILNTVVTETQRA